MKLRKIFSTALSVIIFAMTCPLIVSCGDDGSDNNKNSSGGSSKSGIVDTWFGVDFTKSYEYSFNADGTLHIFSIYA